MIEKYCEEVGKNLISLYKHGRCFDSNLQFPKTRLKDKNKGVRKQRVSEQEARFMFANKLEEKKQFYYAVEVPTDNCYSGFKDNPRVNPRTGGRSGGIDMSIFTQHIREEEKFICDEEINHGRINIEFKKGQPTKPAIKKDLLKLLFEKSQIGVFYHVLEHTNRGTIKKFLKKFNNSLDHIKNNSINARISTKSILLFIVVLEDLNKQGAYSRCLSTTFNPYTNNWKIKTLKEVYSDY